MLASIMIYIREFYRKHLITFTDCKRHYDFMSIADLQSEALWLLGKDTKILPFKLILPRCYALFYEMTERSTCCSLLNDTQRLLFIIATIEVKEEILGRSPLSSHPDIEQLILDTCKKIKKMGHYKKASDLIRDSIRDFKGSFGSLRKVVTHKGSARIQ